MLIILINLIYRTLSDGKNVSVSVANFGLKIQGWLIIEIKL